MELLASRTITLNATTSQLQSPTVNLGALTSAITVSLQRPTTAQPVADWSASGIVRVSLVFLVDGVEYRCVGTASGGIRTNHVGQELSAYTLTYHPAVLFGDRARQYLSTATPDQDGYYRNVPLTRLGETGTTIQGYLLLERLAGQIETTLTVASTSEVPAPLLPRHKNSVAFDAATGANEVAGDGVLSLSHTAGGDNRAAFLGSGNAAGTPQLGSATYGGSGMTELWDAVFQTNYAHAGYSFVAPGTSSTTVTNTLAGSVSEQAIGVVTFTGVDQTTPVGTPQTATGQFGSPSVTVTGVDNDDMVMESTWGDNSFGTIGADQTERNSQLPSSLLKQSTQPGTAGGVMSWSSASGNWGMGAVAFKSPVDVLPSGLLRFSRPLRPAAFSPGLAR